jgi:hypothetical protein
MDMKTDLAENTMDGCISGSQGQQTNRGVSVRMSSCRKYRHLPIASIFCLVSAWVACAAEPVAKNAISISGDATSAVDSNGTTTLTITKPSGRSVVDFDFSDATLDLSMFRDLTIPIKNGTGSELDVFVNASSDRNEGWLYCTSGRFLVRSGEVDDLTSLMTRPSLEPDHPYVKRLGNLFAFPWGHQRHWQNLNTSSILAVTVRIAWHNAPLGQTIEIGQPKGSGDFSTDPAALDTLEMPLVDPFGQLRVGEWPGKLKNAGDLQEDAKRDLALISTTTKPGEGRSRFGGMTGGPELKATGFFRVEKLNGKWWFVDPEGNLFWSLGVNCVASPVQTPVKGREELFSEEDRSEPVAGHYWDNVKAKFGDENWRVRHVDLTQARMFAWGVNTVGAWSIPELSKTKRLPYTLIVHAYPQRLGRITKISDPFSDGFKSSLDHIMPELAAEHANDPWLVGVFIDNELEWESGHELAREVIRSYKEAPARVALIEFLQNRHKDIAGLNKAWDTDYKSLAEIDAAAGPPRQAGIRQGPR